MPVYWSLWNIVPKQDKRGVIFCGSVGTGLLFGLGGHRTLGWCVAIFLGPLVINVGVRVALPESLRIGGLP